MTDNRCRDRLLNDLYNERATQEKRIAHAQSMINNYLEMEERAEKTITEIDECVQQLKGEAKTPDI